MAAPDNLTDYTGLDPWAAAYNRDRSVIATVAARRGYRMVRSGGSRLTAGDPTYASTYFGIRSKNLEGMLIPIHPLLGGEAWQLRFEPGKEPLDGKGNPIKFLTPKGQHPVLATLPGAMDWLSAGASTDIMIVEGVTRLDALVPYGAPAVATLSSTLWKGRRQAGGPSMVLPDFDHLPIEGSRFIVGFDGDVGTKRGVNVQAHRLAETLRGRGATRVDILSLPEGEGLDDWIAREQPVDLADLVGRLTPYRSEYVTLRTVAPPEGAPLSVAGNDLFAPTFVGSAMRLLLHRPESLAVVQVRGAQVGSDDGWLLAAGSGGVWEAAASAITSEVMEVNSKWVYDCIKRGLDGKGMAAVMGHARRMADADGVDKAHKNARTALDLLRKDGRLPDAVTTCWDADVDAVGRYLGTPAGVVDLDSGTLLSDDAARRTMTTRRTAARFTKDATHPIWDRVVAHLRGLDDGRTLTYLQARAGRYLAGLLDDKLLIIVGPTNGGKTTFVEAIRAAVGAAYAGTLSMDAFVGASTKNGRRGATPELGVLKRKRFAFAVEAEGLQGGAGAVALIKAITGDDGFYHRDLYQVTPDENARTTAGIIMACNTVPHLGLEDPAQYRRVDVLDFPTIPDAERDPKVKPAVRTDPAVHEAVLAWLIEGAAMPMPPRTKVMKDRLAELAREQGGAKVIAQEWAAVALEFVGGDVGRVSCKAVWTAWQAHNGESDAKDKAGGLTREGVYQAVRAAFTAHDLPKPYSVAFPEGTGRGWRGIQLRGAAAQAALIAEEYSPDAPARAMWYLGTCSICGEVVQVRDEDRDGNGPTCADCQPVSDDPPAPGGVPGTTEPRLDRLQPIGGQLDLAIALLNTELETLVWGKSAAARKKTIQKVGIRTRLQELRQVEPDRVFAGLALDPARLVASFEETFAKPEFATLPVADWTAYLQALRAEIQALRMKSLSAQKESEQALVPAVLSQWLQPNLLRHGGAA